MGKGTLDSILILFVSAIIQASARIRALRAAAPLLALALVLPTASRAQALTQQELAREVGAVLAWRLSPVIVEKKCRDFDPDGNAVRAQALKSWQDKNAALISSVDSRVAEVVAMVYPDEKPEAAVAKVHEQIEGILLDGLLADKPAEEIKTLCAAEAHPTRPRWTSNGMPHVPGSLAALYDWLVQNRDTEPKAQAGS